MNTTNDLLSLLNVALPGAVVSLDDGPVVRLRYDDPDVYASRAQPDQTAVAAIPGWRIDSAEVDYVSVPGAPISRAVIVSMRLSRVPEKTSTVTTNKTNK